MYKRSGKIGDREQPNPDQLRGPQPNPDQHAMLDPQGAFRDLVSKIVKEHWAALTANDEVRCEILDM